jgi:DNA polymerase V
VIVGEANRLLKEIFRAGYAYQKCGIQLSHIQPAALPGQLDLFDTALPRLAASEKLMAAVDKINRRFPKGIAIAAAGFQQDWRPKAEKLSPSYTTNWQELVLIKAK